MAAPLLVVAGIGSGGGTGGAVARRFVSKGFSVALLGRNDEYLKKFADELKETGGDAEAFTLTSYSASDISSVFSSIKSVFPSSPLRVAVWNTGAGVWKPFLNVTEEDLVKTTESNINGPFAFARESILEFQKLDLDERGTRGTLIFTNATAGTRGNKTTSAFAAGKFAVRALAQSLAKEFGKSNIHVSNVIIDGSISTDRNPEKDAGTKLHPDAIAETYDFLAHQSSSAYTWELDLRPAHETW